MRSSMRAPPPGGRRTTPPPLPVAGGRASRVAVLAGGGARVVAADVSEGRMRLLRETVARTGAAGVTTRVHDFSAGPLPQAEGGFDKILVDATCTGMGVIRRNPDAKWRGRWTGGRPRGFSACLRTGTARTGSSPRFSARPAEDGCPRVGHRPGAWCTPLPPAPPA